MIREARRRAAVERPANLRFEVMDVQSLSFPAQSFDRVLATQLLVHVPEPRRAVHEIWRATRHNGLVALAQMDWDCLVVGASDRELGRRFTHLFCDGLRNGLLVPARPLLSQEDRTLSPTKCPGTFKVLGLARLSLDDAGGQTDTISDGFRREAAQKFEDVSSSPPAGCARGPGRVKSPPHDNDSLTSLRDRDA